MMEIILASASPRRKELLEQIGVIFEVIPSGYEELEKFSTPQETVMEYAHSKALEISKKVGEDSIIIGADTIVVMDEIMGKPIDKDDAERMLKKLSGNMHRVITGLSVIDNKMGKTITTYEETKVYFKTLSKREIDCYLRSGEPMGKAGAYGIQGKAAVFVERLEGCYFNVVGLPIYRLSEIFKELGYFLV